jgi:hypothetical protein
MSFALMSSAGSLYLIAEPVHYELCVDEFCRELLVDHRSCAVEALVSSAGSLYLIAEPVQYELCVEKFCRGLLVDHRICAVGTLL